ncbi:MAG: sigma-70 family RNA polymerase sigma factor [Planctomycetota bacterium]
MCPTHQMTPLALDTSDPDLVAAAIAGEERAWRLLVDRYQRLVYSIPHRYGLDSASCDDVFQTVFTAAFKQLHTLRDRQSLAKWLMTLAARHSWTALQARKKAGTPEQHAGETLIDSAGPPQDALERWETQHRVHTALATLGGRCEKLLRALFLGSSRLDYAGVANHLGIPLGSIGPTRERCMKRLAEILKDLQ